MTGRLGSKLPPKTNVCSFCVPMLGPGNFSGVNLLLNFRWVHCCFLVPRVSAFPYVMSLHCIQLRQHLQPQQLLYHDGRQFVNRKKWCVYFIHIVFIYSYFKKVRRIPIYELDDIVEFSQPLAPLHRKLPSFFVDFFCVQKRNET